MLQQHANAVYIAICIIEILLFGQGNMSIAIYSKKIPLRNTIISSLEHGSNVFDSPEKEVKPLLASNNSILRFHYAMLCIAPKHVCYYFPLIGSVGLVPHSALP